MCSVHKQMHYMLHKEQEVIKLSNKYKNHWALSHKMHLHKCIVLVIILRIILLGGKSSTIKFHITIIIISIPTGRNHWPHNLLYKIIN